MFSLLWSEHCAYKHSRKLLRRLPTEGSRVLMGPGENAGAVDVGAGHAVAFKVESHNHPSAVEPFQGAATGVGGILRDVFALGARPIAVLDSLRFGELDSERSRYLLERVVAGIGHYGNSIGVPTVGGEIYFEAPYEHNCLVNAMCVGLARADRMVRAAAAGVGNVVVLMGASTGRDGIGGASVLASAELAEGEEKRPSVQIGDPFEEKKLMECCLELLDRGLLVALQDLGAAGLTSSSAEMASAGGVGIDLDLDRVPLREPDMEPFEIMISESQERMLAVVEPALVEEVMETCARWQTAAAAIGKVTDTGTLRVLDGGEVVGDAPVVALIDQCPLYDLEPQEPEGWLYGNRASIDPGAAAGETLMALLGSPSLASKRWVFEQYDSIVQSRTVRRPEAADAAVLKLDETESAIAVSIDGNGRRVACDPYRGTVEAVLECAQNLACVGAEPLGLTNCLNFGNPERPHVAWQLDRSVQGLADACVALGVPVVGGNVSLYNETEAGPIYPTPVVGMVGELPDPARAAGIAVARDDALAIVGPFAPSLAGSELTKLRGELGKGLPADGDRAGRCGNRARHRRGAHREPHGRTRRQRRRHRVRPGRVRDRRRRGHPRRPRPVGRVARRLRGELPVRRGTRWVRGRRAGRAAERTRRGRRGARRRRPGGRRGGGRADRDRRRRDRALGRTGRCPVGLALAAASLGSQLHRSGRVTRPTAATCHFATMPRSRAWWQGSSHVRRGG